MTAAPPVLWVEQIGPITWQAKVLYDKVADDETIFRTHEDLGYVHGSRARAVRVAGRRASRFLRYVARRQRWRNEVHTSRLPEPEERPS